MIRYTTPTHTLTVYGKTLTGKRVWVTYSQDRPGMVPNREVVTVTGSAVSVSTSGSDSIVTVNLTQQQTSRLRQGVCRVQVNWISSGGVREASDISEIDIEDNLLEEVVSYA